MASNNQDSSLSSTVLTLNQQDSSLSNRGLELQANGGLVARWKWMLDNSYHAETNPDGIVNLGTAENVSKRGENMQSILRAHGYMFLVVLNA